MRVLIDAVADKSGTPITLSTTEMTATVQVSGGTNQVAAPNGSARGAAPKKATAIKPVFGKPQVGTDDLDVVRAGWYAAHATSSTCNQQSNVADANGDGCVDIVDLQAVSAAQGSSMQTTATKFVGSVAAPNPARTFTVVSTADTPDKTPGNGVCADASGQCTLQPP